MNHTTFQGATRGERAIETLLRELPFFYRAQPRIPLKNGNASKPDFVIVIPERGIVILEVKDWHQILQGDQREFQIVRTDGTQLSQPNPILSAERHAYDINRRFEDRQELFEKKFGKSALTFPWQATVALPYIPSSIIEKFEQGGVWEKWVVLGQEVFQNSQTFGQVLLDLPWRWRRDQAIDDQTLDIIRGVLDPVVVISNQQGEDIGTLTLLQEELTKEPVKSLEAKQLSLLPPTGQLTDEADDIKADHAVRLVRGVAGSGKTLVLMHRAQYIAERYPDLKLLVLTFNVDLAEHLRKRLHNIPINNFHKLCYQISRHRWGGQVFESWRWIHSSGLKKIEAAGLSPSFVEEEFKWRKDLELSDNAEYLSIERKGRGKALGTNHRAAINELFDAYRSYQDTRQEQDKNWADWEDVPLITLHVLENEDTSYLHSYDAILIDEAQDFSPSWLKVIKKLLKPDGALFVCDDPTQSLYRNFSWREKGLDVVGKTRVLKIPFRCTRQISLAAFSLIGADSNLVSNEDIPRPNLRSEMLSEGEKPRLIAFANLDDEINFIESRLRQLLSEGYESQDIAILCHDSKVVDQLKQRFTDKELYLKTFDKMKGLEFRAVFLPCLHSSFEDMADDHEISKIRQKIFTAMTRARHLLFLSHHGQLPNALTPLMKYTHVEMR